MSSTSTALATSACVSCGHQNAPDVKFCGECGHSLFEPCIGCGQPVQLSQKFCGSCGANLQDRHESKTSELQQSLAEGIELGKGFQFERSIATLQRVAKQTDHRFSELAAQARKAIETISEFRTRTVNSAERAIAMAEEAFKRNERQRVIGLLQQVPAALMPPAAKDLFAKSQAHLEQVAKLHADIQAAVASKDWLFIGQNIEALMELVPDNPKYKKLAEQVADKLLNSASRKFGRQDYSGAKEQLHSIPHGCRNAKFLEVEKNVQNLEWLSQQFDREAFVTATLGRLAARFAKESPHDEVAGRLFQELSAANKQRPAEPRLRHACWHGSRNSWLGGSAGLLAFPQSIKLGKNELIARHPGRFSVALGLALQGLGTARVEQQFGPKQGLFSKLGKRKTSCWGIDVGSSGIHAVQLDRPKVGKGEPERVELAGAYFVEFNSPTCRLGEKDLGGKKVVAALKEMAEELELEDDPVWVNLPARELVSRFLRLPPIKDKQADKLMAQEVEQRIPLPIEELELVQWLAEAGEDSIHGRAAAISAAKKVAVESRLDLFAAADIQVAGMQADPIALVNFLEFELKEWWSGDADNESSDDNSSDDESDAGDAEDHRADRTDDLERADSPHQAVALLDCGAATTTLIIVSEESFWFYTIESGGEDLTAILARTTQSVREEAEKLKRNPATLENPAAAFEPLERKMIELRTRAEQLAAEGMKQNGRFEIAQSWCVGGACATHGWIRHVMRSTLVD